MRNPPIPRIKRSDAGYEASLGRTHLGCFQSNAQAEAAIRGADAILKAQEADKESRKLARTSKPQPEGKLPRGIYLRGYRYLVASPVYLGYFGNLPDAIAARDNAPRVYEAKDDAKDAE